MAGLDPAIPIREAVLCPSKRDHRGKPGDDGAEDAVIALPNLARIVEAEYPRFSEAEMTRRRTAVETLLSHAECDHLLFCGANRFGSVVQWLTQWPVTAEAVAIFTPRERDALFVQYVNHAPQARILADKADVKWGGESSIAAAIEVLERRGARQIVSQPWAPSAPSSTPRFRQGSASRKASAAITSGCVR